MGKRAVVALAPGFEDIEAVTPIDVLRRAGVDVIVAAVGEKQVTSAHDVTFEADTTLGEITDIPDVLILPGGLPGSENLGECIQLKELAQEVLNNGGICAAICAAPAYTLAAWGMLEGKSATCYPGFEEKFPASATYCTSPVVIDGNIVTSRGPGTAFEFALTLAELLTDKATADGLRTGMLVMTT